MITKRIKWQPGVHSVADFLEWSENSRLEIQPDFQRKEVWSKSAKIMLIDSILWNVPMPKILVQALIKKKKSHMIVIDGQQRLTAILGFLRDEYALDAPYGGPYLSKRFSQLPKKVQDKILSYRLDVNEIASTDTAVIRDIYSRVNKYNVQLTRQELRRADYPGDFLDLSEQFASDRFFDENRVFTVASSKRMGDVEFVSELLMLLLNGPQEKKEEMDAFYVRYMKWNVAEKNAVAERFKGALKNIGDIWPSDGITGLLPPFFRSRFKQKADFYALFNAIDDLVRQGQTLEGKNLTCLRRDLAFLDEKIEPESEIQLFRKYAIQCVSQSNTIGSRKWRRNVLTAFLSGTYTNALPDAQTCRAFHNILIDASMPFGPMSCPVCGTSLCVDKLSSEHVVIGWRKDERCYQLSNAVLAHRGCLKCANKKLQFASAEYETGGLGDDEFRTED